MHSSESPNTFRKRAKMPLLVMTGSTLCIRVQRTRLDYDDRFLSQRLRQIPYPEEESISYDEEYRSWIDKTFFVTGSTTLVKTRDEEKWRFEGECVPLDN
jgi:hypothetical protein